MSTYYATVLDYVLGAELRVQFTTDRRRVVDYAVVLVVVTDRGVETVHVFDAAHGRNERHRYIRGEGKQDGEVFHRGTLGEGMRAAIHDVRHGYHRMIDTWLHR